MRIYLTSSKIAEIFLCQLKYVLNLNPKYFFKSRFFMKAIPIKPYTVFSGIFKSSFKLIVEIISSLYLEEHRLTKIRPCLLSVFFTKFIYVLVSNILGKQLCF